MSKRERTNNQNDSTAKEDQAKKKRASSKITKHSEAIAKRASQMLAKPEKRLTVSDIESFLLKQFPNSDAEPWDRGGMLVGEGALPVERVAIALDATVSAIEQAAQLGANTLITHHPLFIDPPSSFRPECSAALSKGAGVWAAIRNKVAVMSFHTALDVSRQAQMLLPNMLGLTHGKTFAPMQGSKTKGYGQICKVDPMDGKKQTLAQLSAKCLSVFARAPKVWGDMPKEVSTALTFGGSAGGFIEEIAASDVDVVICGEMKYHCALELKEAGIAIIELGHDISEFPLLAILAKSVADAGIDEKNIIMIDQRDNWSYPESIRL